MSAGKVHPLPFSKEGDLEASASPSTTSTSAKQQHEPDSAPTDGKVELPAPNIVEAHKYKLSAGIFLLCAAGLAIGLYFGLLRSRFSKSSTSNAATIAAITGTTFKTVSVVPAKGSTTSASRRRKLLFSSVVNPTSSFDPLSDYALTPDPTYVVSDEAAAPVNTINQIGCLIGQLRVQAVMFNDTFNPNKLPYVAIVDEAICGNGEGVSTWYVYGEGPSGMGDGKYTTTFSFLQRNEGGYGTLNGELTNVVEAGNLTSSTFFFINTGSVLQGGIVSNFADPAKTDVNFLMTMGPFAFYLHGAFDPVAKTGGAVSSSPNFEGGPAPAYTLDFAGDAINRKKTIAGEDTETCIDFSLASRMLVGSSYTLFSAEDGSKFNINEGLQVSATLSGYSQPATAYASYWGLWVQPAQLADGTFGDPTSLFVDGLTVEMQDYSGNGASQKSATLNLVQARLMLNEKKTKTMADMQGLVMTITTASGDNRVVTFDGTNFVTTGIASGRCVQQGDASENYVQTPITLSDSTITTPTWRTCSCVDVTDGSIRTSGAINTNVFLQQIEKDVPTASQTTYLPSTADFPWGMQYRTESGLFGQVLVEYEVLQTLYGVDQRTYYAGDVVTQAGTGASGIVYSTTETRLFGLSCDAGISVTQVSGSTCGNDSPVPYMDIPQGAKLTQGSAVGYTTAWSNPQWGGVPVTMESGTFSPTGGDITVSMPDTVPSWLSYYSDISGTLTWLTTLSTDWSSVEVTNAGEDCASETEFSASTSGTDGVVDLWSIDSYGVILAWVSNGGTTCSSPTVSISAKCDAGTDSLCCTKSMPTVTIKCLARLESVSDQIIVKLASSTATQFQAGDSNYWGSEDSTKTVTVQHAGTTSVVGSPFWVWSSTGSIKPVTAATLVTYVDQTLVMPGDTVPDLLCYDNCPIASMASCVDNNCDFNYEWPSHLSSNTLVQTAGSCTVKPTNFTFSGIGGTGAYAPAMEVTWSNATNTTFSVSFATITNKGMVCTTPSVVFVAADGDCKTLPVVSLSCEQGQDVSDYRQAHHYTFNALTGILSETADAGSPVLRTTGSYNLNFGPFFADTPANKAALLCDYDETQVCSYKVQNSLDASYSYETGPFATRVSLLDSSTNTAINFNKPAILEYTHHGTTSNSGKNYDGKKVLFQYQGPGNLQGFPQFCVDSTTGLETQCMPPGSYDATIQLPDITIPEDGVLHDLDGNAFYAKIQELYERYPVASDDSICAALDFASAPAIPTTSSFFTMPSNEKASIPTQDELTANYLFGGSPAVIKGTTLYEM